MFLIVCTGTYPWKRKTAAKPVVKGDQADLTLICTRAYLMHPCIKTILSRPRKPPHNSPFSPVFKADRPLTRKKQRQGTQIAVLVQTTDNILE
ncbi:hypothetical protein HRM2_38750 [Desulforapulum autotrophicum HRM2]|uniref:Uncharacterized protein n=1 Tax=Desulforapulum autotrophicum (strain ATCC 43914 / DSM 3382 / VKM B-1955 / HRM2) TaxID=177437 RepID=C0QBD1_DESAH|nr:hypothetical protein HRM2_38750 [Desulforapulum autotrophicum HRM2]